VRPLLRQRTCRMRRKKASVRAVRLFTRFSNNVPRCTHGRYRRRSPATAFIGALAARLVDGASLPEATRFANAAAHFLSAQRPSRINQSPSIGLLNSSRNPIGGDGNRHAIPYLHISIAPIEHLWSPLHIHQMMPGTGAHSTPCRLKADHRSTKLLEKVILTEQQ
jgi:hypothetical protein